MDLPVEILQLIAYDLPVRDIIKLCSTDRILYSICLDERFWHLLVHRDFPYYKGNPPSWREEYKSLESFSRKHLYFTLNVFLSTEEEIVGEAGSSIYYSIGENNTSFLKGSNFYLSLPRAPLYRFLFGHIFTFYYPIYYYEKGVNREDFLEVYENWVERRFDLSIQLPQGLYFNTTYGSDPLYIIANEPLEEI